MHPTTPIIALAVVTAACSNSTMSVNNSCSSSGAAATVSATDGLVFSPSSTTVTHGQSVCWQNTGAIAHTVTANNGTSFNANLAGGQTFVQAFPTAGVFAYHCNFHAGMTGTITVN